MVNTDETKRATGRVTVDDSQEYSTTVELEIQKNGPNIKYIPRFELALHGLKRPYLLEGTILYRPKKRVDIDIALQNVYTQPFTLKGQ